VVCLQDEIRLENVFWPPSDQLFSDLQHSDCIGLSKEVTETKQNCKRNHM